MVDAERAAEALLDGRPDPGDEEVDAARAAFDAHQREEWILDKAADQAARAFEQIAVRARGTEGSRPGG